jgi:hypothetical protein
MSYLEGDSLLKEIERSLEAHTREEGEQKNDLLTYEEEEGDDCCALPSSSSHKESPIDDKKVAVSGLLSHE